VSHVSRSVSLGTTDRILDYVRSVLTDVSVCASGSLARTATVYLRDLDESCDMAEIESLGVEMVRRLNEQRPFERSTP
jgi:hypothetical protein